MTEEKKRTDAATRARVNSALRLPYLQAWRMYRIMTQRELADKAGINHGQISRYESGTPAMPKAVRALAAALDISPEELVRKEPPQS